ncbi:MAG: hypothetical protein AAGF47_05280 [Planctomycetota bacterium]
MFRLALGSGFLAAVAVGLFVLVPAWQAAPRVYDRSSPEAVVESFATMVETGDAGRIHELLFVESESMRAAYARLGAMADELLRLAATLEQRMPEEIDRLRAEAEEAAERGEATGFLGRVTQGLAQQRRRPNRDNRERDRAFNLAVRQLLASPLSSFEEARGRLTTVSITDDAAGLLWDGAPVLPPFGVSMVRDPGDQTWSIVLPLDLPLLSRYRPRTDQQWQIAAYLFQAWENAARDIRLKVDAGEIRNLDQAASEAGAMVLPPTVMIGVAYAKQLEAAEEAADASDADEDGSEGPG